MDDAVRAYVRGTMRLYVGAWKHGVSLYCVRTGEDGGSSERHPELVTSKGTLKLRPQDATRLDDDELRDLILAVL
jgi:hypothetical protein